LLLVLETLLELGKFITDSFLVRLEESDLLAVQLVKFALFLYCLSFSLKGILFDVEFFKLLHETIVFCIRLLLKLLEFFLLLGKLVFIGLQLK
jgi:hypothetical protein